MFLSICYSIVFIISIVLISLIKKSTNPVNGIAALLSSFVIVLCYDSICALTFTVIKIPVDLLSIMICNIILSVAVIYAIKKRTGLGKLEFQYADLLFTVLIGVIIFLVAAHLFNGFTIGYNSGDSTNHFLFATWVVRDKKVNAMFFDPLFNALFIEVCAPFVSASKSYITITIADTLILFFTAIFFYLNVTLKMKSLQGKFISFIITVLCIFGYPMYSFAVGGFLYLTCALMLTCFIIYWLRQYFEKNTHELICLLYLLAGCVSLVFTYTLLAPVVVGPVIIVIGLDKLANISIEKRFRIVVTLCAVIIAVTLVFFTTVALYLKADGQSISIHTAVSFFSSALRSDGYMYSRIYSDLLMLFPALITIVLQSRRKKNVFGVFTFLVLLIIIICFVLCINDYISGYYYYKTYYVLWLLGWICVADLIADMTHPFSIRVAYLFTILFTCITSYFSIENTIYSKYGTIGTHHEGFTEEAKIYTQVHNCLSKSYDSWWLTDDYMQLVEYSMDLHPGNKCGIVFDKTDSIEQNQQIRLFKAITGDHIQDLSNYAPDDFIKNVSYRNYTMLALSKDSQYVKSNFDMFRKLDVIFENDTFTVVSTLGLGK